MSSTRTISAALASLLIFLALDLGARAGFARESLAQYDPVAKTDIGREATSFLAKKAPSDVVFIGSSVVIAALLNAPPDWLPNASSWDNLSSPGQFVSDAYLISSTLLTGERKPKLLVYGVAPRDFIDNNLQSLTSTDTFRYCGRLRSPLSMPLATYVRWDEWLEQGLASGLWMSGNREMLAAASADAISGALADLSSWNNRLRAISLLPPASAAEEISLEKIEAARLVGMVANGQKLSLAEKTRMLAGAKLPPKGSPEFRKCMLKAFWNAYNPLREKMYGRQMSFLDDTLAYCERNAIPLVLVKMPLDQDNIALLPSGLYDRYSRDVDRLGTKYGATVLDFNDSRNFPSTAFEDTVHLNAEGATTFRALLSQRLSLIASRRSPTL